VINSSLCCPLCQAPLQQLERQLRCAEGHSFDQAKQGYWHLLPVQKKRSKDPGDNPEMVQARRRFLDAGHYQPIADQLCEMLTSSVASIETPALLDMGCGEGYYTQALASATPDARWTGLDISKHAVKAACQRSKEITWLVASGAQIPVPAQSLDAMLVMFSRLMPESFAQSLGKDGLLLIGYPAERHLMGLREQIYSQVRPSSFDPDQLLASHFSPLEKQRVSFDITLSEPQQLDDLLAMTPHGQRAQQLDLSSLLNKPLEVDVMLALYRKDTVNG